MNKKKVIYNYNIEQSNQLIKKGMFPIGCGINPKTGGFFFDSLGERTEATGTRVNLYSKCHWNICGISPWYQLQHFEAVSTPF